MTVLKVITGRVSPRRILSSALDIIYPGETERDQDPLWRDVVFLDDPCCMACGFPFEYAVGADSLCARCLGRRPAYDLARAALVYNQHSRKLVLSFKHGGHTQELSRFADHLKRTGRSFWNETDMLIPVPLHPRRLIKRRYNQAAILAQALAKKIGNTCRTDILMRTKSTPSQGLQTVSGRFRNVQNAFNVTGKFYQSLSGKTIVIVDDVFTTGATLEACARTLKRAGAQRVYAVTLARVVKGQVLPT